MDLLHLTDHFRIFHDVPGLEALVTVLIYLVLAKTADIFIDKILKRLAGFTKFSFDDKLISFIHGPVCWTIALMGILHGLILLELRSPWNNILPLVIKSLILPVWWIAAIRIVNWLSDKSFLIAVVGDIPDGVIPCPIGVFVHFHIGLSAGWPWHDREGSRLTLEEPVVMNVGLLLRHAANSDGPDGGAEGVVVYFQPVAGDDSVISPVGAAMHIEAVAQ